MKTPFIDAKVVGKNIDGDAYHQQLKGVKRGMADFVLGRSELMTFAKCPSKWLAGAVDEDTIATEWGSLMDAMLLQPGLFEKKFICTPSTYTATPKNKTAAPEQKPWTSRATFCKEWEEFQEAKGLTVIKYETFYRAKEAKERVLSDEALMHFITDSDKSVLVTAIYEDQDTGLRIPIKILLDLVPRLGTRFHRSLGDFKTTVNAAPRVWNKFVFQKDYDCQAAFYTDVYVQATGEDRTDFRHLIQESSAPYQTAKRITSVEFMEIGRMKYRAALARYAQCLATGKWPDYDTNAPRTHEGWAFEEPEPWMINAAA